MMTHRLTTLFSIAAVLAGLSAGCARIKTQPCAGTASASSAMTCDVEGYDDRKYDLLVPDGYKGDPLPLLIVLHGGGGNRFGALKGACPEADLDNPECLHNRALARDYIVVAPDGTAPSVGNFRTWNAGGGGDRYRCTSGAACEDNVDDVTYISDLIADVSQRVSVDARQVYATGLSNGGAMSHRLACELSDEIAAVIPIGGAMQLTVNTECAPERPVPMLHIHGSEDTCWRFDGGVPEVSAWLVGQPGKEHVPVMDTMAQWAEINGCQGAPAESSLLDSADDGTHTVTLTWQGCGADTELWRIDGGGHTWPRGWQYLSEDTIGRVPQDWGNDSLLDWLDAHPMPAD
jgi:polyhydroxybutyrate depolymerase